MFSLPTEGAGQGKSQYVSATSITDPVVCDMVLGRGGQAEQRQPILTKQMRDGTNKSFAEDKGRSNELFFHSD